MLEMSTSIFVASIRTFFAGREGTVQGHRAEDIRDPAAIDSGLLRSGVSNTWFPSV